MKKTFWPLLYICFAFFTQLCLANTTPALWHVEKDGVTSYLFGTVHVGDEAMKGLPSYVEQAISRSDKVVVEVDISALSPMQIQQRSMPLMMLRNGRTLETELSSKNYQRLSDYFAQKSINIAMFSGLKPWAVLLTMVQIEYQNAGYSEQNGIDKQVLAKANAIGKPIMELESLEQQLEMFSALDNYADEMVNDTFRQLKDLDHYFARLISAWKQGDTDILRQYYHDAFDDSEFGQLNEHILLIERNQNWVAQLNQPMQQQSLFIAVGALHLPEKNGLVNLLREQGFTVTKRQPSQ